MNLPNFLGRKEGRLPSPIRKGFRMSTQSTNQRVSKLSNKIVPSGLEPELTLLGPTAYKAGALTY